jgi:hypothetical protein
MLYELHAEHVAELAGMQPTDEQFVKKPGRFFDGALEDAVVGIAFAARAGEGDDVP